MTYVPLDLRRLVGERANDCCEYCLLPERAVFVPHEVDHIVARKHGGETVEENLCLSCVLCNKHKGSDLTSVDPSTGEIHRLFHPPQDTWHDHFRLLDDASTESLTPIGAVTVRLLQLNRADRVEERALLAQLGWIHV